METNNENPSQYEFGPFPFGEGTSILDIRYDPVFKAVFTRNTSKSRAALSDLISSLIGRTVAVDTIAANEPPINDMRRRYVRFDVSCRTEKGEFVNVEMSFNPNADEPSRLEYYEAVLFTGQDIHGKNKNYNDLKEAYQIAILAKEKFYPDENLIHNFLYYDPDTRISFGGKTRIITVELVKTKPIADKPVEEMTNAELWAVFFQYLTDEEKRAKIIEIVNHEEGIAMAVETLGTFTQSEIEYFRNMSRLKSELDYQSQMYYAKKRGLEEGLKEGRAEGRNEGHKEGLEEGLKEGLDKGRNEASLDIARNLKKLGLSISQIAEGTGLSTETINQL